MVTKGIKVKGLCLGLKNQLSQSLGLSASALVWPRRSLLDLGVFSECLIRKPTRPTVQAYIAYLVIQTTN